MRNRSCDGKRALLGDTVVGEVRAAHGCGSAFLSHSLSLFPSAAPTRSCDLTCTFEPPASAPSFPELSGDMFDRGFAHDRASGTVLFDAPARHRVELAVESSSGLAVRVQRRVEPLKDLARTVLRGASQAAQYEMIGFRLGVLMPLMILAQARARLSTLHCGAIRAGDRALLIVGLNGVGKTTLLLAACRSGGGTPMSDNFCFVRGGDGTARGLPEVLRVSPKVIEEMRRQTIPDVPSLFGKRVVEWPSAPWGEEVQVGGVLLLRLGARTLLSDLPAAEARAHLSAAHRHVAETPDFGPYALAASALGLWEGPWSTEEDIRLLTSCVPCGALVVEQASPGRVVSVMQAAAETALRWLDRRRS